MRALQAARLVVLALVTLASWASCSEVWLYTLVSADYDGVTLMPHLLEHYYGLKVPYSRMLVNVHHNPEKYGRVGLDMILGTCASYRVYCRVWEGPFTSEDHYNRTLALLADYVLDPDDWVVVADSDELQDYGGQTIPAFLSDAEQQGSTYVVGTLLDRLAPGGRLPPLLATTPLPQQFPLECRVVKGLYNGWDFKAFLRAGRANHVIVKPDKARAYFGPCPAGQKCPRGRNIYLEEDWFASTPYAQFAHLYRYKSSPPDAPGLWDAVESPHRILINHYKWHAGVLPSMRDRAQYYSGDCVLGVNEDSCTPRLLHWRESAKTFAAIKSLGRLSLDGMHCQPASDALLPVQTQQQQPAQVPALQQQQQRTVTGAAGQGQVTGGQGDPGGFAAQQGQQALLHQQLPDDYRQQQQQQGQQGPDEPAAGAEGEEGEAAKDSELPEYEPDGVVEEERGARKAARAAAKAASKAGLLAAAKEEPLELPELPRLGGKDKKTRRRQEGAETGEEQQRRLQAGTGSRLNTAGTAAAVAVMVGAGDGSLEAASAATAAAAGSLIGAAGAKPAGIAGAAGGAVLAGAELDEVQQLAAASAAQQAQRRAAAAAVARAGAGMHPGLGSLEAAVETVAVAVEGDEEDRVDAEEGGAIMLGRRGGSGGSEGNAGVARL
ncbi:hypothetical protein N2152v2_010033 [Parachlorella kessleri]